jgi:rhamnogalacturonyl hydrolase YesR
MIKIYAIVATVTILFSCSSSDHPSDTTVRQNIDLAQIQYTQMLDTIKQSKKNPYTIEKDGSIKLVRSKNWTSGFFPGCLWYMYEVTNEEKWRRSAEHFTNNVKDQQFNGKTHDMGFKMFCSYGNGYRLTKNEDYKSILLTSAKTLITRFNPRVGCIRSWDHHQDVWQYPVIIDNMMNLELLFWATKISGDSTFYNIAIEHAKTTLKNHFREDHSSWHVLNYDTLSGEILSRDTHQGYADESSWARGQAWGLYGFTMTYRETGDQRFLDQAIKIAEFILNHKNLPKDSVPYWDFDDPEIPNTLRDASAAAIICSALYELQGYVPEKSKKYMAAADKILTSLSSADYLAEPGTNGNFLLMHAVGGKLLNFEVDVPIIYADYYFLEANMRKLNIESKSQ